MAKGRDCFGTPKTRKVTVARALCPRGGTGRPSVCFLIGFGMCGGSIDSLIFIETDQLNDRDTPQ
jgi:hypothetical protein